MFSLGFIDFFNRGLRGKEEKNSRKRSEKEIIKFSEKFFVGWGLIIHGILGFFFFCLFAQRNSFSWLFMIVGLIFPLVVLFVGILILREKLLFVFLFFLLGSLSLIFSNLYSFSGKATFSFFDGGFSFFILLWVLNCYFCKKEKFFKIKKIIFVIVLFGIIFLIFSDFKKIVLYWEREYLPYYSRGEISNERVGNLVFETLENERIEISGEGKCILLDFVSETCAPCLQEFSGLSRLSEQIFYKKGFQLVVVFPFDSSKNLFRTIKKFGLNPKLIVLDSNHLANAFGIEGVPTKILITQNKIVYKKSGGLGNGVFYFWEEKVNKYCPK